MKTPETARILAEIADEHLPAGQNLLPGVMSRANQARQSTRPNARLLVTTALVVILLVAFTFSLPGVASAIRQWLGYIPGIGTVDRNAPLRVLENPVSDSRDGFTLTVESAVLDANRTVLTYRIEGKFPTWSDPSRQPRMCQEFPLLRLPDGTELRYPVREGGQGSNGWQWKEEFGALPVDQNQATLVLPCLAELPAGEGPQNWQVDLRFVPAPPDLTVFPLVDMVTPRPAADEQPPVVSGMSFQLLSMATLEEGYYLQTNLAWEPNPAFFQVQLFPDAIHLRDSAGQEVPVWQASMDSMQAWAEDHSMPHDWQTGPITAAGPAQLVLEYVGVSMSAESAFTLDLGDNPQPGQVWQINRDLSILGYPVSVVSAEYIQAGPGEPALLLMNLFSDGQVLSVSAADLDHELNGSVGSPVQGQGPFRAGWYYQDEFPSGQITITINSITVRHAGPWTITWTPPVIAPTQLMLPTALPPEDGACQVNIQPAEDLGMFPGDVSGKIAYTLLGEGMSDLFIATLDGSETHSLGKGIFPDLSPDGRWIAYGGPDEGLHIQNLENGEDLLITGTNLPDVFDTWPKWSPDGTLLAFDRVIDLRADIFAVDASGSNLRPLLDGSDDERFLDWAEEAGRFYYTVTLEDELSVRQYDLSTGQWMELSRIPSPAISPAISPDGSQVVYITERGLFLQQVGSAEEDVLLVSTSQLGMQIHPTWSPDGSWLAVNYWPETKDELPAVLLLKPATCEMVALPDPAIQWIASWVH